MTTWKVYDRDGVFLVIADELRFENGAAVFYRDAGGPYMRVTVALREWLKISEELDVPQLEAA